MASLFTSISPVLWGPMQALKAHLIKEAKQYPLFHLGPCTEGFHQVSCLHLRLPMFTVKKTFYFYFSKLLFILISLFLLVFFVCFPSLIPISSCQMLLILPLNIFKDHPFFPCQLLSCQFCPPPPLMTFPSVSPEGSGLSCALWASIHPKVELPLMALPCTILIVSDANLIKYTPLTWNS